jgi:hypothetical protein
MSASVSADVNINPFEGAEDLIENIDRPPQASSKGTYAISGKIFI